MTSAHLNMDERRVSTFWSRVNKEGPTQVGEFYEGLGSCWEWTRGFFACGYGAFRVNQNSMRTHRIAILLSGVEIPDGKVVMHLCDNPRCCRPSHLRVATPKENGEDAARKGRISKGPDHHLTKQGFKGEKHGMSKLTEADIKEIRRLSDAGESRVSLSKKFGVANTNISMIALRQTWKQVV